MDESERYFRLDPEGVAEAPGRYVDIVSDIEGVEFVPGLLFRPLVGKDVMLSFVTYEPHTEAPRHAHAEEQVLYVLEGELEVDVGDETRMLRPGQAAVIPPHVPHAARTHELPCYQLDVFHPPRQALLDVMGRRSAAPE
jgi:quercetin dioxygenase-like cupin family protein